jgi:hypothetical protein
VSVEVAREEEAAEGSEVVIVIGKVMEWDMEPGHGPLPRRQGRVAAIGDA